MGSFPIIRDLASVKGCLENLSEGDMELLCAQFQELAWDLVRAWGFIFFYIEEELQDTTRAYRDRGDVGMGAFSFSLGIGVRKGVRFGKDFRELGVEEVCFLFGVCDPAVVVQKVRNTRIFFTLGFYVCPKLFVSAIICDL